MSTGKIVVTVVLVLVAIWALEAVIGVGAAVVIANNAENSYSA